MDQYTQLFFRTKFSLIDSLNKQEQFMGTQKVRRRYLGSRAVSAEPDSPPTVLNRTTNGVLLPTEEKTAAL